MELMVDIPFVNPSWRIPIADPGWRDARIPVSAVLGSQLAGYLDASWRNVGIPIGRIPVGGSQLTGQSDAVYG